MTMSLLGSLTNRIFFGSALLAVGSIAIAIYNVNVAVTRQAEEELRRGLHEADTIIEEYRTVLVDHFTREARLIADLPRLKASVDTQRSDDHAADRGGVPAPVDGRPPAHHRSAGTDPRGSHVGQCLIGLLCVAARRQVRVHRPAVELVLAASGRNPADCDRAHLDRSAPARNPRHAQRRRQPRRHRGEPFQVADQQRNRLRDDRDRAGLHAGAGSLAGAGAAPRAIGRMAKRGDRHRGLHRQDASAAHGAVGAAGSHRRAARPASRRHGRQRHHPPVQNRAPGLPQLAP